MWWHAVSLYGREQGRFSVAYERAVCLRMSGWFSVAYERAASRQRWVRGTEIVHGLGWFSVAVERAVSQYM